MSSGNKYHRTIISLDRQTACVVDVYDVIAAFDVKCPARQHALKKILCSGIRGKGSEQQDLSESIDAIRRAIDLCKPHIETIELECSKVSLPIKPGQIMDVGPSRVSVSEDDVNRLMGIKTYE